jgi:hypothetical protein
VARQKPFLPLKIVSSQGKRRSILCVGPRTISIHVNRWAEAARLLEPRRETIHLLEQRQSGRAFLATKMIVTFGGRKSIPWTDVRFGSAPVLPITAIAVFLCLTFPLIIIRIEKGEIILKTTPCCVAFGRSRRSATKELQSQPRQQPNSIPKRSDKFDLPSGPPAEREVQRHRRKCGGGSSLHTRLFRLVDRQSIFGATAGGKS